MEDQLNEQVNNQLDKVSTWLGKHAKTDKWNFKLYGVPYVNSALKQAHFKATNLESTNAEQSIQYLRDALILYGDQSPKWFLIRSISGPKDPKGIDFYFVNPLYNPNNQKGKGFNRMSGMNSYNSSNQLLEQERMHNKEVRALDSKITKMENEAALKEIREEMEQIRNDNRTKTDKIQDFAQTPLGLVMLSAICGQLGINIPNITGMQSETIQAQNEQVPKQEQKAQPKTDQAPQPQQQQQPANQEPTPTQVINLAILKLQKVFPDDVAGALLDLAIYCENNEEKAKNLLNLAKLQQNG